MIIYLAGPIFGCSDEESTDWRKKIKDKLKLREDKPSTHNKSHYHIFDPFERDLRGMEEQLGKIIVEGDKEMIDKSDILLVGLWKVSAGTMMEILYAWENDKKVFVINGLNKISPWIKYHSHAIFNNIDEAIDFLQNWRA